MGDEGRPLDPIMDMVGFSPLNFKFVIPWEWDVSACQRVIVVLLGLKRRRAILPKIDTFLIQQELAGAIWSTCLQLEWRKLNEV